MTPRGYDTTEEHVEPRELASIVGSAGAFAEVMKTRDEREIRRALRRADEMYPDAHRITDDGGVVRYYRIDPSIDPEDEGPENPDTAENQNGFRAGSEYVNGGGA